MARRPLAGICGNRTHLGSSSPPSPVLKTGGHTSTHLLPRKSPLSTVDGAIVARPLRNGNTQPKHDFPGVIGSPERAFRQKRSSQSIEKSSFPAKRTRKQPAFRLTVRRPPESFYPRGGEGRPPFLSHGNGPDIQAPPGRISARSPARPAAPPA